MPESDIKTVREYYDSDPQGEYERISGRPEFLITTRFMKRVIKSGDSVLDIGGGPGIYSHWLARLGCKVTLCDLSEENVRFAREKARESGLDITAVCGDARDADKLIDGQFDHVLLMGPLYHLLEEADRIKAVNAALSLLKNGGTLWSAFILMFSGIIFEMKNCPELIVSDLPMEVECRRAVLDGDNYGGDAFTKAFFISQGEIEPFMRRFPLEKLFLFAQEGILSPCEKNIMSQPENIVSAWLDFAEKLAERPEMLSWGEHAMFVGRKTV
ncbi:MAG: class I SAM-dependent methyltransferase [Eubacteriales bacterium]|nr:class I SAM-dependent methyltransferase [Eubacteriales bacterium]MDD3881968.1 class I SAM-dependent methyltransferase [Eubacteriales bacterium]MDD4513131.1 class I SAM-dependent methyltransferase [Eubacteriales bacterium]